MNKNKLARATRDKLVERFPACFVGPNEVKRPLKIGLFHDIRERCPDLTSNHVALALNRYTDGPSYLDTLVKDAVRVDLDGQPSGIVTEAEAVQAARRSVGTYSQRYLESYVRKLERATQQARDYIVSGHTVDVSEADATFRNDAVSAIDAALDSAKDFGWWRRPPQQQTQKMETT